MQEQTIKIRIGRRYQLEILDNTLIETDLDIINRLRQSTDNNRLRQPSNKQPTFSEDTNPTVKPVFMTIRQRKNKITPLTNQINDFVLQSEHPIRIGNILKKFGLNQTNGNYRNQIKKILQHNPQITKIGKLKYIATEKMTTFPQPEQHHREKEPTTHEQWQKKRYNFIYNRANAMMRYDKTMNREKAYAIARQQWENAIAGKKQTIPTFHWSTISPTNPTEVKNLLLHNFTAGKKINKLDFEYINAATEEEYFTTCQKILMNTKAILTDLKLSGKIVFDGHELNYVGD